jgi:hypothetical protein
MSEIRKLEYFLSLSILSISLIFSVLGCGSPANPPKATQSPDAAQQESMYKILSPQGIPQPIDIIPLAPRLDSLKGKTIYVVIDEPEPIVVPALRDRLKNDYPETDWKFIASDDYGGNLPDTSVLDNAEAIVRGNAWSTASAVGQAGYVAKCESSGIPSVLLGFTSQKDVALEAALNYGCPNMRFVQTPNTGTGAERVSAFINDLIKALTQPLTTKEKESGTYTPVAPPRVLFEGTLDEAQKLFQGGYSDNICDDQNLR